MSAGSGDLGVLRWIIDGDDAPLDAKLNSAEAKVRAWASRMAGVTAPVFGGPGGASTFSGNVTTANAQGGLTLQSAPWGGAQWRVQQPVQTYPVPGPEFAQYSAPVSPSTYLLSAGGAGLGGSTSSRAAFAAAAGINTGGGGGGRGMGGFRGIAMYHFGLQIGREVLQAEEASYEFGRVLSRGSLDEQVSAGVAAAKSYDTGLTGAISRFAGAHPIASMAIVSPIPTIINWAQGGSTEDIRNAVENAAAARAGQLTSDEARRGTARIARRIPEIGMSAYNASISHAHDQYDEGMDEVKQLREKAKSLTGENNQTANALSAEADSREKVLQKLFGTTVAERAQRRGLQVAGGYALQGAAAFGNLVTGVAELGALAKEAAGDTYGAQRDRMEAEFARQDGGTLSFLHRAQLETQDKIHQRELTERAEDLGVSDEELAARNPYLSSGASYRIRRQALQDKKALALARYKAQNPKDATGAAALSKYYDSETDLLDQQGAMEETQNAIAQSTNLQVGQQLLMRNPRGAAIAAIRGRTAANVLAGGVDENGMPSMTAIAALAQGGQQLALENQRQDDRERLLKMSIGGEHDVLNALLGRRPDLRNRQLNGSNDITLGDYLSNQFISSTASMSPQGRAIVGQAVQQRVQGQMEAEQLLQQGNTLGAIGSLSNSVARLDLLKQNLFQHVEARGVNLNLQDVSHPETSTEDLSKAIAEQRRLLMNDLADRLPQIISDLIQ